MIILVVALASGSNDGGSPAPSAGGSGGGAKQLAKDEVLIQVVNAVNGSVPGLADRTGTALESEGYQVAPPKDANGPISNTSTTRILYRPDARKVAAALRDEFFPGAPISPMPLSIHLPAEVLVLIGDDYGHFSITS